MRHTPVTVARNSTAKDAAIKEEIQC